MIALALLLTSFSIIATVLSANIIRAIWGDIKYRWALSENPTPVKAVSVCTDLFVILSFILLIGASFTATVFIWQLV